MTGREIYKIWAPKGAKWIEWVRPVPFIELQDRSKSYDIFNFIIPPNSYIDKAEKDTAIIVDVSGYESIKQGLALAKLGFRPIPLYNGTNGQVGALTTVDNEAVEVGLVYGALKLKEMHIPDDAQPVFLLDTNRLNRLKINVSVFDNSWDIYNQDLPSAEYFLKNGVKKIIVHSQKVQKDLSKILYKFQSKGITVLHTDGYEKPKAIKIKKPAEKELAL